MDHILVGNDTAVITLLLLFITGLLTKRFVPWWVHEEVLKKLAVYEDATPELITEVKRLMLALEEDDKEEGKRTDAPKVQNTTPQRMRNPKRVQRRA